MDLQTIQKTIYYKHKTLKAEKMYKKVTSDGKVKVSININPEILEAIDKDGKKNGLTRSGWITVACLHFLKKNEGEKK